MRRLWNRTTVGGGLDWGWEIVVLPCFQLGLRLLVVFFVSLIAYLLLYSYLLPKALIREPVYFDYSAKPQPVARLNLLQAEKQWYYINPKRQQVGGQILTEEKDSRRFLSPGFRYSIDLTFNLAHSQRNSDLGKFMVYLTMVDSTGESIAKSARPIPVPYLSKITLLLDAITKFPARILGLYQMEESTSVCVPVMNEYREPSSGAGSSTEVVEMSLSTDMVDIGEVFLTIMPVLGGISFYMHYYPRSSFLVGVSVIMGLQISVFVVYSIIAVAVKYLASLSNLLSDERQDLDLDEGEYNPQIAAAANRTAVDALMESDELSDRESLASTWRFRRSGLSSQDEEDSETEVLHPTTPPSTGIRRRPSSTPRE